MALTDSWTTAIMKKLVALLRRKLPWERFAPFDVATQIFLGILGRTPTRRERSITFARLMTDPTAAKKIVSEIVSTSEFARHSLPRLLAKEAQSFSSTKKIFFVHLPKASGTSLREQLISEMGIPSLEFYGLEQDATLVVPPFMDFWPLIAGHMNVFSGPRATHTVVTTVREPTSRWLSQFRQQTRLIYYVDPAIKGRNSAISIMAKQLKRRLKERQFSEWLRDERVHQLAYFADPLGSLLRRGRSASEISNLPRRTLLRHVSSALDLLDEVELGEICDSASNEVDLVSWSDSAGVDQLLSELFPEHQVSRPERRNDGTSFGSVRQVQLTVDDLARLQELSRVDRAFIAALQQKGKLPLPSLSEEEDLAKTAQRLGFILP